jgi:hypothetical protein
MQWRFFANIVALMLPQALPVGFELPEIGEIGQIEQHFDFSSHK